MRRREFLIGSTLSGAALTGVDALLARAWAALPAPAQAAAKPEPAATTEPKANAKKIIAIDAGHGGKDPGCIGVGGTHEKMVTMAVARDVARRLEATGHYKVVLTRPTDVFVPLANRVRRARAANAQLFLSLHADSGPHPGARGFSVYTLAEHASDDMAAALARRENAADRIGGINFAEHGKEVSRILLDLLHRETANGSLTLAHDVVATLGQQLQALTNPHREANFAVLRAPDIPSALVEMGFLSNPEDERLLNQRS